MIRYITNDLKFSSDDSDEFDENKLKLNIMMSFLFKKNKKF